MMMDLYTPEDIAARLGITPLALIRFARKIGAPLVQMMRAKYRITHDSVEAIYRAKGLPPPERPIPVPSIHHMKPMSPEDIVKNALIWKAISGIYFLIRGDRIVYVGQSLNAYSRIDAHRKTRRFDGFFIIPCEPILLNTVEEYYIRTFWPEENNDMSSQFNRRKEKLRGKV